MIFVRSIQITIQESALKIISEKNYLYTISPNKIEQKGDIGVFFIEKINFCNATTFPGFCSEHEAIFKDYENNKKLTEDIHYIKQIYRTVCLIYKKQEFQLKQFEILADEYIKFRDRKLFDRLPKNQSITKEDLREVENFHFIVTV